MRAVLLAFLLLAGCATQPPEPRDKAGATEAEFMQARDRCMAETAAPYSDQSMGTYPAAASAQKAISCPRYDACMAGQGFRRAAGGRFYAPIVCRD